ncbi:hypothetical protein EUGRSUZ_K01285 [Eucalyptus grandis]|uniref:Uncharacterized protein n=2 Tax=Eucalyptus grandis TaxID=71139 RepID=A0ACC3IST2_EUCGR|nr:hypothetical protein EUGRSUZ_K01285 [Eucalyptus grandis]
MHLTWNPWLHLGSTRTFSPSTNSPRQIGHSVAGIFAAAADPYTATGIWRRSRLLSPVVASLAAACSGVSAPNLRLQRSAQRTMELSPRAQISAHSRAARMITMLVSKLVSLMYESVAAAVPFSPDASGGGPPRSASRNLRFRWSRFMAGNPGKPRASLQCGLAERRVSFPSSPIRARGQQCWARFQLEKDMEGASALVSAR